MGYEVDFLAVGEGEKSGDAIAIRFGNLYGKRSEQRVVVIDGGYQESGKALVEHIKRYYYTDEVDLVVSTHPDRDHASGLSVVLNELHVGTLWMHQPWKHSYAMSHLFRDGRVTDNSIRSSIKDALNAVYELEQIAERKRIKVVEPFCGLRDDSKCLSVLSPTRNFYKNLLPYFRSTPEPRKDTISTFSSTSSFVRTVAESWNYETLREDGETSAENDSSVILLLNHDNRNLLFTADAGISALTEAVNYLEYNNFDSSMLNFIQIPHHGSRRNVSPSILNRLLGHPKSGRLASNYKEAFVSASIHGSPKHPSKKVTNAFHRRGYQVHTTQGINKLHRHDSPDRLGWTSSIPEAFHINIEE
jgi:beta-lactamase superfamily II metal-dependent hydrolase